MLNKQQRNFRKIMSEREKQRSRRHGHDIYSYRDDRFESEQPKRQIKKPLFQIGGAIGLLVLSWNISALFSWIAPLDKPTLALGMQPAYETQPNNTMHTYIQRTETTDTVVNTHINSLMDLYNENMISSEK